MGSEPSLESRYQACLPTLKSRGQEHLLHWWAELNPSEREQLLDDLESIPWNVLDPLIPSHVLSNPVVVMPTDLQPAFVYPQTPGSNQAALYAEATDLGRELIRAGKVGAFTVAGGQGTRLGFDGPKGAVAISPVRGKTFFQLFAETIRAVRTRYAVAVPWYIMTSPTNHEQTIGFLKDHKCFGLPEEDVFAFPQEMLPTFDFEGRILLEDKYRVALAPDGHGGSLKALVAHGALGDMRRRGIEIISYFQVDNPLVKPFDPLFLGLHAKAGSEMSTKVARKADDLERVGNLCVHEGKIIVVEYTHFPENLARARNSDGTRKFDVGNLAIHLLSVDFVERIIAHDFQLPYRRAEKVVTSIDERGSPRTPGTPNGVKLETFVFDALLLARNPLLLEVDRAEEFSPVKNAEGVDSVETAIRDQIRRAARWLEAAGVAIPRTPDGEPDLVVEIAPCCALDAGDIARGMTPAPSFEPGEHVYLTHPGSFTAENAENAEK